MSWWDYGYLVTQIGRRVPISNPRQSGVGTAAEFFLATEPRHAADVFTRAGVRYVIADAMLQASTENVPHAWQGLMFAMALAAGRPPSTDCGIFRPPGSGGVEPMLCCHPEYFRTMAVQRP